MNPNNRRTFYESDDDETKDSSFGTRNNYIHGQDDNFEPSVEIVINKKSPLWQL